MTPYIYREIGGITDKDGNKIIVPQITYRRLVDSDELVKHASRHCALDSSVVQSVLMAVQQSVFEFLCEGHSVELEGMGTLTPSLHMKDSKPVSEPDKAGKMVTHNAQNIEFKTVLFRPSRQLVTQCRRACRPYHDLHRQNEHAMDTPLTLDERRDVLTAYLDTHSLITIKEYMQLTGLRHTTAWNELHSFCHAEEALLTLQGSGSHKYFTKR